MCCGSASAEVITYNVQIEYRDSLHEYGIAGTIDADDVIQEVVSTDLVFFHEDEPHQAFNPLASFVTGIDVWNVSATELRFRPNIGSLQWAFNPAGASFYRLGPGLETGQWLDPSNIAHFHTFSFTGPLPTAGLLLATTSDPRMTHAWVGNGNWSDSLNWSPVGLPHTGWATTIDNDFDTAAKIALVASNSTVDSIVLRGTAGAMILEVQEGMTLTVNNGITVGPGGILKGKGTVLGDIINDGGTVTAGMPEPCTARLLVLGLLGFLGTVRISGHRCQGTCGPR